MNPIHIPFYYLYMTRLRNWRSSLLFFCLEFMSLAAYCLIVHRVYPLSLFIYYVINMSLYEIGYVYNDYYGESRGEPCSHRREDIVVKILPFSATRFALIIASIIPLGLVLDYKKVSISAGLSVGVLLCLVLHSMSGKMGDNVRSYFVRIFSFSFLSIYKYVPVIIPGIGLMKGAIALVGIVIFHSVPRILTYVLRKYSNDSVSFSQYGININFFWNLLLLPIALYLVQSAYHNLFIMYCIYFTISALYLLMQRIRRCLTVYVNGKFPSN